MSLPDYNVRIEPHGRTLRVRADQFVLEAALAAGLNLPHSCRTGHCSSCIARLRRGVIRYPGARPLGLTEAGAHSGSVLLCQALACSDLELEVRLIANVSDVEIKTLPCRIDSLEVLSSEVVRVRLRLPAVEPLSFRAGQYLDVLLPDGRRRSFSIASAPGKGSLLELHVKRVADGIFTPRLFDSGGSVLRPGSLLTIEGPLGQFVYADGTGPALMIAGGTGFAPLKSMLLELLDGKGAAGVPARPVHLFWGARSPTGLYEDLQLSAWARQHPQFRYTGVISGTDAPAELAPHHRPGLVHEVLLAAYPDLRDCDVFAAGPAGLIEAVRAGFPQHGLPAHRLHFDSFDPAPR